MTGQIIFASVLLCDWEDGRITCILVLLNPCLILVIGLNNHIRLLEHPLAPNRCCVSVTIITIVIEGDTVEG